MAINIEARRHVMEIKSNSKKKNKFNWLAHFTCNTYAAEMHSLECQPFPKKYTSKIHSEKKKSMSKYFAIRYIQEKGYIEI